MFLCRCGGSPRCTGKWHCCLNIRLIDPDDDQHSPHGSLQQLAQTLILHALDHTANGEITEERKIQADAVERHIDVAQLGRCHLDQDHHDPEISIRAGKAAMARPFLSGIPAIQHNGQDQEGQTHNDRIQREAARIGIIIISVKSINEVHIQGQPDHSLAEEGKGRPKIPPGHP